ncbi:hypothetical protein MKX01_035643 [Papaver californicum]|nr:hypothetical protein MKX01_035643 [Papaver californicum]
MEIVVKDVYDTNISHVLFGIGGSTKTWASRKHYTMRSRVQSGRKNSLPYRVSEDTGRFKYGSKESNRIARIVLESYRLGLKNVRWFVMGDDDTVFFTENLVTVLAKYDHNQMYYIGGNSESVEQDMLHTYGLGFGGAGFAISYPLVMQLVKVLDGCIDRHGSDERIGACLKEIGVPNHTTRLPSGRILQQSICHDLKRKWSVVSDNVLGIAFQTFQTWKSWRNEPFTFNTRPMSPEPCDRPLVYFLDKLNNGDGVGEYHRTLTSYKRFTPEPGGNDRNRAAFLSALAVHTVNITASRMDSVEWSKAPRKQCCEITSPMDGVDNSVIQIRIKRCNF